MRMEKLPEVLCRTSAPPCWGQQSPSGKFCDLLSHISAYFHLFYTPAFILAFSFPALINIPSFYQREEDSDYKSGQPPNMLLLL